MDDYPTDPHRDKPLDFYKDAPYPGFENASQDPGPPGPGSDHPAETTAPLEAARLRPAPPARDAPESREGLSCCAQAALLCGFTIVFVPLALAWAFSAFIGDGDTGLLVLICEVLVYFAGLFWILKSGKK